MTFRPAAGPSGSMHHQPIELALTVREIRGLVSVFDRVVAPDLTAAWPEASTVLTAMQPMLARTLGAADQVEHAPTVSRADLGRLAGELMLAEIAFARIADAARRESARRGWRRGRQLREVAVRCERLLHSPAERLRVRIVQLRSLVGSPAAA